jgi:hypothetical protein
MLDLHELRPPWQGRATFETRPKKLRHVAVRAKPKAQASNHPPLGVVLPGHFDPRTLVAGKQAEGSDSGLEPGQADQISQRAPLSGCTTSI